MVLTTEIIKLAAKCRINIKSTTRLFHVTSKDTRIEMVEITAEFFHSIFTAPSGGSWKHTVAHPIDDKLDLFIKTEIQQVAYRYLCAVEKQMFPRKD